jgi:hypothetical protein
MQSSARPSRSTRLNGVPTPFRSRRAHDEPIPLHRKEAVMLQAVHMKNRAPQASSLYCRWICVDRPGGLQLVAVWMDSEMRAFEREFHPAGKAKQQGEQAVECEKSRRLADIRLDVRT